MTWTIRLLIILSLAMAGLAQTGATAEEEQRQARLAEFYRKACGGGYSDESASAHGQTPAYATENTKLIVEQMIAAHGGMRLWQAAPTLSFTHVLVFGEPLATEFWISRETTEIKTGRTYQDWPAFDGKLTHDGTKTWTQNWQLGNPPGVNVNAIYHILALPWLTQKSDAVLEQLSDAKLGQDSVLYRRVKMTFKPGGTKSPHQFYTLYIHPETHLLTGISYNITYGAFLDLIGLPKEEKSLGPYTHIIYNHKKAGGLVFPEKYDTFDPANHNAGRHIAYSISVTEKFDEARMKMPAGAVVDTSKAER
jgi:hypothetical protein